MKHRLLTVIIASAILLFVAIMLFPQGSGYNSYQTNTFTGVAVGTPSVFQNSLIKYHQLIWTVTGTVTSCTVALDTSADNVSFTAGGAIAGQTCTSTGSSAITGIVSANYVRVNMTAFVGTGSVVVVYEGWAYNPSGGGGGTTINPTNNVIPVRSNGTTFIDSHWTDNGTTLAGSETVTTTGELQSLQATNTGIVRLGSDLGCFVQRNASNTMTFNCGSSESFQDDVSISSSGKRLIIAGAVDVHNTAPTIAGAGCGGSGATITPGSGTDAFAINVGATPGSACTITMPAASNTWDCDANDRTTKSSSVFLQQQTGVVSTTSVTITNFNTAAAATAFVASDVVEVKCKGR